MIWELRNAEKGGLQEGWGGRNFPENSLRGRREIRGEETEEETFKEEEIDSWRERR